MAFNIDPALWTQLNRLLDEALDLPLAERSDWLDALDVHSALKPPLRQLLARAASIETGEFLGTLPRVDNGDDPYVQKQACSGEVVGPYRLLRELGSGGMGEVWLAERTDGMVNRPVALKLPHFARKSAGLAERMAREREILATLNHPNIATLYDAGIANYGQPYLALEYVEGLAIDVYCRERQLDLKSKLKLFAQVANAVAAAHAKLIVHRDLKPSNILVTQDGQVRLLDFGIAKLLGDGQAVKSQLTELSGRVLTPDYASPEQVLGDPITIASDVYSLGVILYELLTGARPYKLKRDSRGALEDAIVQTDPVRPSEIAPSRRKLLRGDLDIIVLKALKKKPEDRYATVHALVDDVFRHLDRKPVMAQADDAWYRIRKFAARHAVALSLAGAIAVTITLGAAVAMWQMIEANQQRDAALLHQRRAQAFSQFMGVLLNDVGGSDVTLTPTTLLDRGVGMLERQSGMEDAVSAFMWYELSRTYRFHYQTRRERELLERSAVGARRIGDANLLAASECAASWSLLERELNAAESKLADALRALRSANTQADYAVMECLRAESRLMHARGDVPGAIALIQNGLQHIGGNPRGTWYYAGIRDQLAGLQRAAENNVEALRISEDQLQVLYEQGRQGSGVELMLLSSYGRDLCRVGEYVACAATHDRVLASLNRAGKSNLGLVGARSRAGIAALRLGDPQRALKLADEDLEVAGTSGNLAAIAQAHWLAASALLALKRFEESELRIAKAQTIWQASPGMFASNLLEGELLRAEMAFARGDLVAARRLTGELLRHVGYPTTTRSWRLDSQLRLAATIELRSGNAADAEKMASDALRIAKRNARTPTSSGDVGLSASLLCEVLTALHRDSEAVAIASLAEASMQNGFGANHPVIVEAQNRQAQIMPPRARY